MTRNVHDLVFQIYANMLNIEPEAVPGLVAGACILDSIIVLGIAAFKWRANWFPKVVATWTAYWGEETDAEEEDGFNVEYSSSGQAHPAE